MIGPIEKYPHELQHPRPRILSKEKPIWHSFTTNKLENIVFDGTPQEKPDIVDRLFSDKSRILNANVKALLKEIQIRETLDSHLIRKIEEEIFRLNTRLINIDESKLHYQFERFIEIRNIKIQIENNILELEKEKRKEYLECWRDLMFLRKYLFSSLKDYWDLAKKRDLLSSDPRPDIKK